MAAFTATYVIQAPVNTIQSFIEARTKQNICIQMPSNTKHIKAFLKSFNTLVIDMQAQAIQLSAEEAMIIWINIQQDIQNFSEIDKSIRNMIPVYSGEKDIILIIKSLWSNINQLAQDIKLIAHLPKIDEMAADYVDYFGNMIKNAIDDKSNTRVIGKKALLDLFEN
jgi:hypothetical protein